VRNLGHDSYDYGRHRQFPNVGLSFGRQPQLTHEKTVLLFAVESCGLSANYRWRWWRLDWSRPLRQFFVYRHNRGSGSCSSRCYYPHLPVGRYRNTVRSIASTFTDSTLGTACTGSGGQPSGPGCTNPSISDAFGNFGFWAVSGVYTCQVSSSSTGTSTFPCVAAGGGGGTVSGGGGTSILVNGWPIVGGSASFGSSLAPPQQSGHQLPKRHRKSHQHHRISALCHRQPKRHGAARRRCWRNLNFPDRPLYSSQRSLANRTRRHGGKILSADFSTRLLPQPAKAGCWSGGKQRIFL